MESMPVCINSRKYIDYKLFQFMIISKCSHEFLYFVYYRNNILIFTTFNLNSKQIYSYQGLFSELYYRKVIY